MIKKLTIIYKLDEDRIDEHLDRKLKEYITDNFKLEWTGQGYDLENEERDITFIRK